MAIGLKDKPRYLVDSWVRAMGEEYAHRVITNPYAVHYRLMLFLEKLNLKWRIRND